jgi:ankyrin repeat protein
VNGDRQISVSLKALQQELNKGASGGMAGRLFSHAKNGYLDGINLLITAEVDVNELHTYDEAAKTALMAAAAHGRDECVRRLLAVGALLDTQDSNGETALMAAAANGHVSCVEILINAGADLNVRNADGDTAMMVALSLDQHRSLRPARIAAVKLLIKAGADVTIQNNDGLTVFRKASCPQYNLYGRDLNNAGVVSSRLVQHYVL